MTMDSYRAYFITGRSASWQDKLKLALLGLAGGAILIAAVILSLGLALVLIPLGFVAYLFRRPLLRALFRGATANMEAARAGRRPDGAGEPRADGQSGGGATPQARPRTVTIDADYTVVDERRPGRPTE